MNQVTTVDIAAARAQALEVFSAVTNGLTTTDKKGNVMSFERSIMFASKDKRAELQHTIYETQCNNGKYGRLIRDALAAKLVHADTASFVEEMMGEKLHPAKEVAIQICQSLVRAVQKQAKEPKGQRAYYFSLVKTLLAAIEAPKQ